MSTSQVQDARARAAVPALAEAPLQCLMFLPGEEACALDIRALR